ncbi:MAG TPA: class II aldolase/adducin family protein, partial [Beijerinckiaceae bacterium]|nr:class II aldolase/adducin family protein [Beijerinckiaceae bacterium]
MPEEELRAKIVRVAQALDLAGFCPSKSGNVSARWRDGLLITPSGLPYAGMQPADIVEIDISGRLRA